MHGVKRSLVCFVAVASANPPFIQPSETSRETTESMNDGLIKLIKGARFLLNTPTAQQNHPRARHLRRCNGSPSHAPTQQQLHGTHPTHTASSCAGPAGSSRDRRDPSGSWLGPLSEESRPKFCCAVGRGLSGGGPMSQVFSLAAPQQAWSGTAAGYSSPFFFIKFDTGMWCRRISFLRLVRGLSVFLRSPATTGHMSLRRLF